MRESDYARMSFGLSYRYEPGRRIWAGGIDGKNIPNAYRPTSREHGRQSGDWCAEISDYDNDPYLHAFSAAVCEAIHEALEWFKVDGKVLLDPHGQHELAIANHANAVARALFALADPERIK